MPFRRGMAVRLSGARVPGRAGAVVLGFPHEGQGLLDIEVV
ncbi:hypothetical protein GA0115256_105413, partial [Streptomyces sp. DconLS]